MNQKESGLRAPAKIGLGIAGVAVVIVATGLLEAFFSGPGSNGSWPAAISAVSTIVLVVVTAIYAGLTGASVAVQREAIGEMRTAEISQQVRSALQLTYSWVSNLREIERSFPIKQIGDPSEVKLPSYDVLVRTIQEMLGASSQLPFALALKTRRATEKVQLAVISCQLIAISKGEAEKDNLKLSKKILQDAAESGTSHPHSLPELTWDNVLTRFYRSEDRRALMNDETGAMPEWVNLVDGSYVIEAREAVTALQKNLESWVRRRDSSL